MASALPSASGGNRIEYAKRSGGLTMAAPNTRTRPLAPTRRRVERPAQPRRTSRAPQLIPKQQSPTKTARRKLSLSVALVVGILSASIQFAENPTVISATPAAPVLPGRLPERPGFSFEENIGQAPREAHFVQRSPAATTYLTDKGIVAVVVTKTDNTEESDDLLAELSPGSERSESAAVMRMEFVGANPAPEVSGLGEKPGKSNYFIGKDGDKWVRGVRNFSKVEYKELYAGIDAIFYDDGSGRLEYDFIVSAGTDPSVIELGFKDGVAVDLDNQANLVVTSGGTSFYQYKPFIYQHSDLGEIEEIDGRFQIDGNKVRFGLGEYDRARPVVIDPVMVYSSYLGGTGEDSGSQITVDALGNAYVTGKTYSLDFPVVGAYQGELACAIWCTWPDVGSDAFLTKIAPDGSSIIYSTYLGAPDTNEEGSGIGVDSLGRAYVGSGTNSDDFPISNASQPTKGPGKFGATITKFSPDGSSLEYSTYFGGVSSGTALRDIRVDGSGATYLGGSAGTGLTTTIGVFQPTCADDCASSSDGFVAKLDSGGFPLYASYIGGRCEDPVMALANDDLGNLYIAGRTCSTAFPVVNAFQPAGVYPSRWEGYVAKINPSATALIYSSYLSGSLEDTATGIAVDSAGSAYVVGRTFSADFPVANAFEASHQGGRDNFLTKVSPNGSSIVFSTYLGGVNHEGTSPGVVVNSDGYAYVAGSTPAAGIPPTADFPIVNPLAAGGSGGGGYITKFNAAGNGLAFSTYLGGYPNAIAAIAIDGAGDIYVTGATGSPDFPVTPGVFQPLCGACDPDPMLTIGTGFITKITQPEPNPVIEGTTGNSTWGSISVYHAITGTLVGYQCCNATDSWSIEATPSRCDAGGGYKILMLAREGFESRWYNDKANWSEADCVDSPQSGVDSTLMASNQISGYVKDAETAADIDGAYLYFFTSSGKYSGYVKSGTAGQGRYQIFLNPSESYKVLVKGPPANEDIWYSSAQGFTEASSLIPPQTANFSLRPAGTIAGWVTQNGSLLPGAFVSAYTSCGCQSPKNSAADGTGRYSIKVVTTASSGYQYRVRAIPPSGQTRWYSEATNIWGADDVAAPTTNVNLETPP
ncbi:MAG: hypothetical protein DCC49_00545 [Acidobacteria bacterium]|nr:MAG: hypothetical protein DCC49_00545 [Acidobacteriota bacterium]